MCFISRKDEVLVVVDSHIEIVHFFHCFEQLLVEGQSLLDAELIDEISGVAVLELVLDTVLKVEHELAGRSVIQAGNNAGEGVPVFGEFDEDFVFLFEGIIVLVLNGHHVLGFIPRLSSVDLLSVLVQIHIHVDGTFDLLNQGLFVSEALGKVLLFKHCSYLESDHNV